MDAQGYLLVPDHICPVCGSVAGFVLEARDKAIAYKGHTAIIPGLTLRYCTACGEGFDAVVELFEGDCSGLSEIGCADATVGGELEEIFQSGLVVGNTYLVRLFNYGGAEVSPSSFTICAKDGLSGIRMDEGTAAAGTELFPNPAEGVVNITWSGSAADVRIDVLDMTGRVVHQQRSVAVQGALREVVSIDATPGAYVLRVTDGAIVRVARFIIR